MPITKEKKKKILEELKEKIERQKIIILVDFSGLKIRDFSSIRKKLKESGNEIKVVKKTLTNLAFKEKEVPVDIKKLRGELALVFGYTDEITPSKIAFEFSKENQNFKILGAILERNFLEKERIIELASLPTKEELLARFLATLSSPITSFLNIMNGNLRSFIFVLNQIQKVKK